MIDLRSTRGVVQLRGRAIFELTGTDRVRFLNGQATNDVRRVSPGKSLYACVLTAKGKLCADIFVTAKENSLLVDSAIREVLAARLERYIISDDVTLRDVSDELALFHFLGMTADEVARISGAIPIAATRFGPAGFDVFLPAGHIPDSLRELLVEESSWEALRIAAGIPRWGRELSEETLPAEAGLDRSAVDFSKGCYVGQEVVSRIRSVGHVNKSLHVFATSESGDLAAGSTLFSEDREVGNLTSAAGALALGYLKRGVTSRAFDARMPGEISRKVEMIEPLIFP